MGKENSLTNSGVKIQVVKIIFSLFLGGFFFVANGQDLQEIKNTEAFKLHGNIGASANYYTSNEAVPTRPPWSWNVYGNFSPEVYGIALPASFVINQFGNSYSLPFAQFGISPTYKWAKLHLGYRNIRMSPLVFDGQSFRGVGIELNPGIVRFAAFYGRLNKKINEDTTAGRFTQPQFSRIGYGAKIGVGNKNHYFDLIYFYAKDDTTSASVINKTKIQSQENTVLGASFKTTIIKKFILEGDVAASGITDDLSSTRLDSIKGSFFENIFSRLMPFNTSTSVHFGGQASLSFALKNYNTSVGYRRVEPGFKSLGTPYMLNDVELINWANNLNLMKGKVNINASASNQHNNLNKNLTSQLNTFVSSLNVNATPDPKVNLNFDYSGYLINQKDGTMKLGDSIRLNQQVHQFGLTPSYSIFKSTLTHTISGNINYMILDDKNPATTSSTSSHNLSSFLDYTIGLAKSGINFSIGGLYSNYVQDTNKYSTYGVNIGSSGSFLKNKNLSVQLTAGYLINNSSYENTESNLTVSGSVGYRYNKHSITLNANYIYTPYNPINEVIEKAMSKVVASQNLMASLAYNYSF